MESRREDARMDFQVQEEEQTRDGTENVMSIERFAAIFYEFPMRLKKNNPQSGMLFCRMLASLKTGNFEFFFQLKYIKAAIQIRECLVADFTVLKGNDDRRIFQNQNLRILKKAWKRMIVKRNNPHHCF